jgi:uncharacterized protein (TIGR00730 family)
MTTPVTKICVFMGASPGKSPAHMAAAVSLAEVMHANNIHLVYGGGTSGLMGQVARRLVELSGPDAVHGIIPAPLVQFERGPVPTGAEDSDVSDILPDPLSYGQTTVVKDMHARKHMMAQEVIAGGPGSGFIALTGGYGTLEELMEVVTWNQLGIHNKGIVALNIEGYWDGLFQWISKSIESGFVGEGNAKIIVEAKSAEDAVDCLRDYKAAVGRFNLKWEND